MQYTLADIPGIAELDQTFKLAPGYAKFKFDDGKVISMHTRDAIIHHILWLPFRHFNIPIPSSQVYEVFPMKKGTISKVQTTQYEYLLATLDIDHLKIVEVMFEAIYQVYEYSFKHLGYYQEPLDLLDLVDILEAPELKDILNPPIQTTHGTSAAEAEIVARNDKLCNMLRTPGALANNPILVGMQAGVFKDSSISQLLVALGPRSDIDGRMLPHIIANPVIEGMKSMADMATESASSRLTTRYNKTIIRLTQSFNREMRLFTCNLTTMYRGDCGRRLPITHQIMPGASSNYTDKVVMYKHELVEITSSNHKKFEGEFVGLISPVACNHVDGVCEQCAGRTTTHPWHYMPKVRPGGYASAIMCTKISQNILSAKHFTHTSTVEVLLTNMAREYFMQDASNNVKFNRALLKDYKKMYMLLDVSKMGHLNDLEFANISPEGFGIIDRIGMHNSRTKVTEMFDISENNLMQHLSQAFLDYMREIRNEILVVGKYYHVPLAGFSSRKTVFEVIEINDDMVAFAKRVKSLFKSGISDYSNIQIALQHIANMIYSKLDINIFYLEIIVKAILNGVLPEDGQVNIAKLGAGIANSNIATKLGHGDVKRYLISPDVSVVKKKKSPFDMFMGF